MLAATVSAIHSRRKGGRVPAQGSNSSTDSPQRVVPSNMLHTYRKKHQIETLGTGNDKVTFTYLRYGE